MCFENHQNVGKNIIFQNKTLLVMFDSKDIIIIKHFGTNFEILNIF